MKNELEYIHSHPSIHMSEIDLKLRMCVSTNYASFSIWRD